MLEQFKVKPEDAVRVREENLRETVEAIFAKMGLDSKDSALGADVAVSFIRIPTLCPGPSTTNVFPRLLE